MANDYTKAVVKVGSSSTIRANNIKLYRAITFAELASCASIHGAPLVIIEYISRSEYDQAKTFISEFLKVAEHRVVFYVNNNDEYTCGIADEFALDIYMTLVDLHKFISEQYNICAYTNIDTLSSKISENGGDVGAKVIDFEDSLSNGIQLPVITEQAEEVYIYAPVESKDDLEYMDGANSSISLDAKNFQELKAETDITLISELHTVKVEHESLQNQLKEAVSKVATLNSIKMALTDEVAMYKSMLTGIENDGQIIEDPIEIGEYAELKEKLRALESGDSVTNSADLIQAKETIASLNADVDRINAQLVKIEGDNTALQAKLDTSKETIADLESTNEKYKTNLSTTKQSLEQLRESSKDIAKLNATIEELSSLVESYKSDIATLQSDISLEMLSKQVVTKALTEAVNEVIIVQDALLEKSDEIEQLGTVVKKLEDTEVDSRDKIQLLTEENNSLSKLSSEVETRIDLAKAFVQAELDQQRLLTVELESKLALKEAALIAKEFQYNELTETCGTDANGASSIRENNKTLEAVVTNLKNQIASMREELDRSKQKEQLSYRSILTLTESNDQMRTSIKAMSIGLSAGADSSIAMVPINYSGKGMIIPIFGSGSFGITTTAMSVAIRLASKFRVLYVDFDMVTPKADGWFKVPPIEKMMPNFPDGGLKMSGLGALIEKGAQYFISNSAQLIKSVVTNKGGCIDYISGIYAKYDTTKLLSTDFSSFFNFCGNSYNYVIIDMGRLGGSSINDSIIKLVSDIAYRNVIVTTNNKFDTRTFRIKTQDSKITIDKSTVWVLNMCRGTKVEDTTIKATNPAVRALMQFESDLYGNNLDFTKEKLTRDKLETIMEALMGSQ